MADTYYQDLRKMNWRPGDLVLIVNPKGEEEDVVYVGQTSFTQPKDDSKLQFEELIRFGKIYCLERLVVPNPQKVESGILSTTRAKRIYVGRKDVFQSLQSDKIVKKMMFPNEWDF